MQIKILSILKLVSSESLAGNDFSEGDTQAEAHCERNLHFQLWSMRRKILHRCSRNFCRHYYKSCWLKVTDWLLAFAFCNINQENWCPHSLAVCFCFLKIYVLKIGENCPRKILRQKKNWNFSILNSSAPSQNNKTSRTSCRRLFENFLPSTPTEITFEISLNLARS